MALKTTLQQLEEVQAAITEVMTSQAQRGPSGSVERPQLDALAKREEALLARYYRETGKSISSVVHVVNDRLNRATHDRRNGAT